MIASKCFLLQLLAVLELLFTHCISTPIVEDTTKIQDLIRGRFYTSTIQKVKLLYDSGLNYSRLDCLKDFVQFWESLDSEQQASYFDSFGKIGAGILTGNIIYLGYYDECTDIGNTDFCRFPFDVTLTTTTTESNTNSVTVSFEFGMCFPSSCDVKDFYSLFYNYSDELFYNKSFTIFNTMNHTISMMPPIEYEEPKCPWRDLQWTTSSIIMLTICALFLVLVIIGTVIDVLLWLASHLSKVHVTETEPLMTDSSSYEVKYSINKDDHEPLINAKPKLRGVTERRESVEFVKDLILSFSLYKTVPVILATHQPTNAITSINGIRVISMCWVILGHTLVWALEYNVLANVKEVIDTVPKQFLYQLLVNATFSVDDFFLLSGLLVSYLTTKEMEHSKGNFPIVLFYLHRLLRLSPAYYFILFFNFKLLPYVGSGPLWYLPDVDRCEKYWWTSTLYINNFYPTTFSDQCYSVTWYLANDMQFYIVSPIFLILLYHFWKIGLVTIAGTMLASTAVIGVLAGIKDLNANFIQATLAGDGDVKFPFYSIYEKPYCRINAYLVGVVLGFVLYKKWKVKLKFWMCVCFYSALWIIAGTCCLTMVFGEYQTWNGHPFTKSENILYYMFSRTIYSIGIALMIYACHNGFGGIINSFLSWSFWVPLSRLTFMTYLCHPIVLSLMYGTMRFRFIYTDWTLVVLFAAAFILSYCLGLLFAIVIEYPLANVESAVYKLFGVKRRQ